MNQDDIQHEADAGMRLVVCVVLTASVVIAFVICGCASSNRSPAVAPAIASVDPLTNTNYLRLTWTPDYMTNADGSPMYSNEVTAITRTIDLTIPHELWVECFEGHTNQCFLPMIGSFGFYGAYNKLETNE